VVNQRCNSQALHIEVLALAPTLYDLGLERPRLHLGLNTCTDNFLASPSNSRPDNHC